MSFLNWLFGLFGYEWVKQDRPADSADTNEEGIIDMAEEEGWNDLYDASPKYVLRKKSLD
ncbi:MAG: hypothetical protein R3189_09705 [Thiomicrorhabdus chilensis]|uniref:hypothetical protein n=1 Tax=Thiomicrorhabdus chilensis TaxID=63656 RepID=UPI00299E4B61|nr:hypothetical protein [Thiomicrorhabdus chilensis]MDX1348507.1 hypothetical protein [Thiomicrorhabdus chilensis]